jgi:signal transduction histidine kinase
MDSESVLPVNERNQHLERLLEISRSLSAALELEPFLQSLISAAADLTGCEAAFILELDEGGDHLRFLAPPGNRNYHALPGSHQITVPHAGTESTTMTVKLPLQTSVAGWVFQTGQPAVAPDGHWEGISDVAAVPRTYEGADPVTGFTTRSLMAVPIIYLAETLGVLEVVNKTEHTHYTEEDRNILESLASQAGIAIQNTHLKNKLQHSLDQISQLDRMKSDFIAISSHELRTPLGLILGHATFLREVIQADQRADMDVIVQSAMRLKEIIDDLVNMDNVQRGVARMRARTISIKSVVEEVMIFFNEDAKHKGVNMRAETGQEDLLVEGEPSKIRIALSNVVQNAISFTNPGGHIIIVAESIPGYIKVSVIDDGIGIPPKDLPNIFERFYQVESHLTRKHGGMGLGLSVSKLLVEMHGGRIWAESVEGKGSNFSFLLPISTAQADTDHRPLLS